MDFIDDYTNIDKVERTNRTLWVGNLHPKVSHSNVVELFYQVGPIEYVEFAFDEREVCENFAWVVFKHSSSVEDSIKLFCNTKLYGIPIITKNYSKHFKDPVFNEQLDYFKQLINIEHNNQSKQINKSRWNNNISNKVIPESLPEPPTQNVYNNANQDIYYRNSGSIATQNYKNTPSLYQHSHSFSKNRNSIHKNEHNFNDRIYHYRGNYQKSDRNSTPDSMEMPTNDRDLYHQNYDRDSYRNQNFERKHRDYNIHASYNRKESKNFSQESVCINARNSVKNELSMSDLRNTMHRKRLLNHNNQNETNSNIACKPLDLRETLHRRKNSRHEDLRQHESDSNNRWSERNHKNTHGSSSLSNKESRKNNYNSERYIETNTRYKNHNYDRNFNPDKSYVNLSEYEHEYPNNYDSYNQEKYTSYNNKYNCMPSQNLESNSHQYNSYHPYKRHDEGHKKKEYKNSYEERSEINYGRSYNKKGIDQSRQHYYS